MSDDACDGLAGASGAWRAVNAGHVARLAGYVTPRSAIVT